MCIRILILCLLVSITNGSKAQKPGDKVRSIFADEYGHQWFGTDNGLIIMLGDNFKTYAADPSTPQVVTAIEQQLTPEGPCIWISSESGICRVKYSADGITFCTLFPKDSTRFESDITNAIALDVKNSVFVATTAGIGIFALNVWKYLTDLPDIGKNRFTTAKAKGDTIYFGTKGEGVSRLVHTVDGYTGASSLVAPWSSLAGNNVTCIFIDSMGNRWYGSDKGISRHSKLEAKEGWTFSLTDKLQNKYVTCMTEDKSGNFWIGTQGGLVVLNPSLEIHTTYTVASGLPCDRINSIYLEKDGSLWIGTDLGVAHIQGTAISTIVTSAITKDFIDLRTVKP